MGSGGSRAVAAGVRPPFVLKHMGLNPETHLLVEGYWGFDKSDKSWPWPHPFKGDWEDKEKFCNKLQGIEGKLEADMVSYRGLAESRLEEGEMVGAGEYVDHVNGVSWPEGFGEHYIRKHNVLPSEEFFDYVLAFDLEKPKDRLEEWLKKWHREDVAKKAAEELAKEANAES
eukprot:GGOE01023228.1.p1 GENE.GGOE01023228.1~~GGOE01023228.1.p1  ORF type:complete len:183 (+),score=58.57 GGOE01023228.1:34-549(+)